MTIQLHRESGLSIRDAQTKELVYRDSFENALVDAGFENLAWPDENILRIFTLADERIALVRETETGLRQEAATDEIETLFALLGEKREIMVAAQLTRLSNEAAD